MEIPLEEQHPEDKCSKSLELCTSVRQYTVLSLHFRPCDVLPESCFFQILSYPRAYVCKTYSKRHIPNIVGCYMLCPFAHPVAFCWMLLCFVGQSLKPVKTFNTVQTCATLVGVVASVCKKVTPENCFFQMSFYPRAYVCITYKKTKGKFPEEHLEACYRN